jgi:hypothetical protein
MDVSANKDADGGVHVIGGSAYVTGGGICVIRAGAHVIGGGAT